MPSYRGESLQTLDGINQRKEFIDAPQPLTDCANGLITVGLSCFNYEFLKSIKMIGNQSRMFLCLTQ